MCDCTTVTAPSELCNYCLEEYHDWLDAQNTLRMDIEAYQVGYLHELFEEEASYEE